MSNTEVRFPDDISYESTGGPEFSTEIITTQNGCEQRNINWTHSRGRYNISHGIKTAEQLAELIQFFRVHKGRALAFRFKDWTDYRAEKQLIGIGNNTKTTFQLIKTYTSGNNSYVRKITKPVYDTLDIYCADIKQVKNTYEVSYTTGIVTFSIPPHQGVKITANFEFDIWVRFDTDVLTASLNSVGSYSWKGIPLVEVK